MGLGGQPLVLRHRLVVSLAPEEFFYTQQRRHVVWWSRNYDTDCKVSKKVREPRYNSGNRGNSRWEVPDSGIYKINCSALVDVGKNKVGIGVVIRDDPGFVMASCSQIFDANVAGIMAICRGDESAAPARLQQWWLLGNPRRLVRASTTEELGK